MENEWKASQFNEFLGRLNGNWVIYNNLSGGMIEVKKNIYDSLLNNRLFDIDNENHINSLKYGKFITESRIDEYEELRKKENYINDSVKVIGLQILPVSGCNFKCSYCYESSREPIELMTENVMDDIIKFVRNTLKPSTEYLNISWFGGEPLLAIDRIEYLSEAFIKISEENNLKYNATIISNGYLLTRKNVDRLLRCGVVGCQVTIDGPEEIHDRRRMLKNGGKTWKRIVDNLKHSLSKSLSMVVRINIDKTNIGYIESLFSDFKRIGIFDKVSFSLGLVTKFGKVCKSVEDTLLTREKAKDIVEKKKILELMDGSKNLVVRPYPDLVGCVAAAKNSFVVGKDGELYKCAKTVGDTDETCGHISKLDWDNNNLKKWLKPDMFSIKACQKCSILPTCNGAGCLFDMVCKNKNIYDCNSEDLRKRYREHLILFYRKKSSSSNKIKGGKK